MSGNTENQQKDDKTPTAWLEVKVGEGKVSLNYRGTTEKGLSRYVGQGDEPYAMYVGENSSDLRLYQLKKNGEQTEREQVANLFLNEGEKDGKAYFFLSNRKEGITVNVHGNVERANELKANLRAMSANVQEAIEAAEARKTAAARP